MNRFYIEKGNYSPELKALILTRLTDIIKEGHSSEAIEAMAMLSQLRNELSCGYE